MSVHHFQRIEQEAGETQNPPTASIHHRAAEQSVKLRGIDRQDLLVRPRACVFDSRQGADGGDAISIGLSAASANGDRVNTPFAAQSNPFSTRFVRPGAIPYVFADGQTAESLVARLARLGWRHKSSDSTDRASRRSSPA